ncbi:hypothetical protein DFH08DRAFT_946571 [Mycena albidolilacea]|uniref:Uncharacterized protein n=1 Tax=Mycena albidolilacea TaxID=1033008 RepID=A0AAD7F417_9AGAR|nr:hypothetical protein DFH08DRAFT_946571 [Mycena albidolilacea]
MLKPVDGQDITNEETNGESDDDELPQLPDGLITMDPVPEEDVSHQKAGSSKGRSPAASARSQSKGKGKAVSAPAKAPMSVPQPAAPTPVLPLIANPDLLAAPTDSMAAPESSPAPFGDLGDLGDLVSCDFTSEDLLREGAAFDYEVELSDVLARNNPPVTDTVSDTSSVFSQTLSTSISDTLALHAFSPPSELLLAFTPSRTSASLASSSTSTPAADALSVLPPHFEFGATPPASAPFTFTSSTREPRASSTSADHDAYPGVANATGTQTGTNTVSLPTRPKPKPKHRVPSALARFNAVLAAHASPVPSVHMAAGPAIATPATLTALSSTPAAVTPTVATPAAAPSMPSSTLAAAAVTPTVATPVAGLSAPSSTSATVTSTPNSSTPSGPTTSSSTPATPTPAPVVYLQSRPMGNPPQGHALGAPVVALVTAKKQGRPRKNPAPEVWANEVGVNEGTGSGMSAAAWAEMMRINKEATALRKQTAEQLQRSREMAMDGNAAAGKKRAHPDDGVFVMQRPKRAAKVLLNADGTEMIRPMKGRRGELRGGERLGGSFDLDTMQVRGDEELGSRLQRGKRKAVEGDASKAPARKCRRKS